MSKLVNYSGQVDTGEDIIGGNEDMHLLCDKIIREKYCNGVFCGGDQRKSHQGSGIFATFCYLQNSLAKYAHVHE